MALWLRRGKKLTPTIATSVAFVLGMLGGSTNALAQPDFHPVSSPGPFSLQAALTPNGPMAIVGDTALVVADGVVHIFERDPASDVWTETDPLMPSDAATGFGRALAFDGTRAVVSADGAAYLFRRSKTLSPVWREVTRMLPSDGNAAFGSSVAVDRDTILVGGASGEPSDAVYVFKRTPGQGWHELKVLTSPDGSTSGFGATIALSNGTAVVRKPTGPGGAVAYIFDRDERGTDNWGLVKRETGLAMTAVFHVTFKGEPID